MGGVIMFGNFFGAIKSTHLSHKVCNILLTNYSLSAPVEEVHEVISRYSNITNEHELAIWYLTDWVQRIYLEHPKAISEVTKYIRVVKMAEKSGQLNDYKSGEKLFFIIKTRFGVDPSTIKIED